jgi:uncharacterized membrane protein YfcA
LLKTGYVNIQFFFAMEFDITYHFLFVIIGIFAGIINILAGSGSILTLGIMSLLGVPTDVANGTNRIGIVLFGLSGTYQFNKKRSLDIKLSFPFVLLSLFGAFFGTLTALRLSKDSFDFILGCIFFFLFFVVLLKPEEKISNNFKLPNFIIKIGIFFIGFYAGFIQVGAGVILLIVLKILLKKNYTNLNPIKLIVITSANVLALILFTNGGLINWEIGISLAIGQIIGSFYGVKLNQSDLNINSIIQASLLVLITLSVLKFWKIV